MEYMRRIEEDDKKRGSEKKEVELVAGPTKE